jgi:hypothetical protein
MRTRQTGVAGKTSYNGSSIVKSECCPNLAAIVLVSGDDCPNSLFEPSHESGVVGIPQRFTLVAEPNVDVRFSFAGYVLD